MIEVNEKKIKMWSMFGQRNLFGMILTELASEHEDIFAITADFTKASGLDKFKTTYPDRFLSVGIAEQNMIGLASGIASEGHNVFTTSFASFITTRCYEQVKIHAGYMKHNIKVIGLASGFGVSYQGNTHYGLDDICLMRNIPNMTIISPADCTEVAKATEALCSFNGPAYLRLCGDGGNPIVNANDYNFEIGKAIPLKEGKDVVIFATGQMVYQSLLAADILKDKGVDVSVVNVHTISPLDKDVIAKYSNSAKLVVTAEEGFLSGGLYAAICDCINNELNLLKPSIAFGLKNFPHAGSYQYILKETGLDSNSIAEKIINKLNII